MYTVSQCDVFSIEEYTLEEMIKQSTYDHFWVVGGNVTVIPERFSIQRTAPLEVRLFRDSSSNTVAGALMNRGVRNLNLDGGHFSDSTFKGSTFMNIQNEQFLDIVHVGFNPTIRDDIPNTKWMISHEEHLYDVVRDHIRGDYFYLVPENFKVSEYFEFDARTTNVLDCHYSWFGEKNGNVSHQHSIKLLNRRILLGEPCRFLRYGGYLELPYFSGSAG